MNQLICDSLDRVRTIQTICATVLDTLDSKPHPRVCSGSGSWSLGIGEQTQAKTAIGWGRHLKGIGGENPQQGMPLEENWTAMEAEHYC